ncbi:LysR substrate-binding domain-containing protein [Variovorax flavidus]|uniref:LysR substrate-binding domain-containing protein n=1 Tax=Variovorax flavidus TaxID=3053501 RepID=UPI0033654FEB
MSPRRASAEPFVNRHIFGLDIVAVLGEEHGHLVSGNSLHPAVMWSALKNETLLTHDLASEDAAQLLTATGASPARLRRVQLTEAIVELARSGHGVGVLTAWPGMDHGAAKVRILPLVPRHTRDFHAIWRRSNPRRLPIEQLATYLRLDTEKWTHSTT